MMDMHAIDTSETNELVPAFYGSEIKKSKACAYCWKHKLYLTVGTMKTRGCLAKQCNALHRIETHDSWRQRRQKKELKKLNKQHTVC